MAYCSRVIREQIETQEAILTPRPDSSVVAVRPPGSGAGMWAGAPSAVRYGDEIFLAYRMRRPVGEGRGYAVVIARSADGETFDPVLSIGKEEMKTESLERPALVLTPAGHWRLYLSCATDGTKHWRVEVMEAAHPGDFDPRTAAVVLPGSRATAVKDPVIVHHDGRWHLWASVHPLSDAAETDRMTTEYAVSPDGLHWSWHGVALAPRPGGWDARGVRVSAALFTPAGVLAYYDGRATAAENFEERTGVATGAAHDALAAIGDRPAAQSPAPPYGLRYLSIVELGGQHRLYYELTRPDGSHDLRTELR